jgi:hypothetical protein
MCPVFSSPGHLAIGSPRRRQPARRLLAPAVTGAAALALLAGCGGGTLKDVNLGPVTHRAAHRTARRGAASPLAVRAIRLAARQARRVNSYQLALDTRVTGGSGESTSGVMTIQLKPSLLADFTMNISVNGKALPVREIMTAHALYLKVAALRADTGKPWVKLSDRRLGQRADATISKLVQVIEASDPLTQTAMLTASKDLRRVGTQVINGVRTTHYTGSYSAAASVAKVPAILRGLAQSMDDALGITTVHFDAWLDRRHEVRKLITVAAAGGTRFTSEVKVLAINQPVNIELPPASQVAIEPSGSGALS